MKQETDRIATRLADESVLDDFLLVGGTALSVHLEHRLSEDLDFATARSTLPVSAIGRLLDQLRVEGRVVTDNLDRASRDCLTQIIPGRN